MIGHNPVLSISYKAEDQVPRVMETMDKSFLIDCQLFL